MTIEPRVVRTLKRNFSEDHFLDDARKRKQVSDDILEIIYDKVKMKHESIERKGGRGLKALIDDGDD